MPMMMIAPVGIGTVRRARYPRRPGRAGWFPKTVARRRGVWAVVRHALGQANRRRAQEHGRCQNECFQRHGSISFFDVLRTRQTGIWFSHDAVLQAQKSCGRADGSVHPPDLKHPRAIRFIDIWRRFGRLELGKLQPPLQMAIHPSAARLCLVRAPDGLQNLRTSSLQKLADAGLSAFARQDSGEAK